MYVLVCLRVHVHIRWLISRYENGKIVLLDYISYLLLFVKQMLWVDKLVLFMMN